MGSKVGNGIEGILKIVRENLAVLSSFKHFKAVVNVFFYSKQWRMNKVESTNCLPVALRLF